MGNFTRCCEYVMASSKIREPLEEMVSVINSVSESINKPIIWSDDRFPEEYKKIVL